MAAPFAIAGVTSGSVAFDGLRVAYLTAGPDDSKEVNGDGEKAEREGDRVNGADGTDGAHGTEVRGGSDPPIVLLHGGGLDRAVLSWKHTIPALATDRRVYAPDWPGFGASDPPDVPEGAITTDYFLTVLERFRAALGVEEVTLCGISMGGGVALGYSLTYPERVSRLVLIDSYGLGGVIPGGRLGSLFVRFPSVSEAVFEALARSRRLTALTARGVVARGNLDATLVREMHETAQRPGAADTWRAFQRNDVRPEGLRTNYLDRLPDLSVPTLLIHGERDPLVPVEWAIRAGTLIPDAEVRAIPDCGHWPPREIPDTTNEHLRAFL